MIGTLLTSLPPDLVFPKNILLASTSVGEIGRYVRRAIDNLSMFRSRRRVASFPWLRWCDVYLDGRRLHSIGRLNARCRGRMMYRPLPSNRIMRTLECVHREGINRWAERLRIWSFPTRMARPSLGVVDGWQYSRHAFRSSEISFVTQTCHVFKTTLRFPALILYIYYVLLFN